jgi:hypothetical protein
LAAASPAQITRAFGASTNGNVVLQFCGLTVKDIPAIAEVNVDKFGCVTPGNAYSDRFRSRSARNQAGLFLVLPWHFKAGILQREKEFLASGGKMIFSFAEIEIV